MRDYKTYCDKCGREIAEEEKQKSAHIRAKQIKIGADGEPKEQKFFDKKWQDHASVDLCPECWFDLNSFIFGADRAGT